MPAHTQGLNATPPIVTILVAHAKQSCGTLMHVPIIAVWLEIGVVGVTQQIGYRTSL